MKSRKSSLKSLQQFLPVVVVTFTIAGPMEAATLYWDGAGGTQTFTDAANWNTAADGSGGDPALAPGSNDIALFNITGSNVQPKFQPNGYGDIGGIVVNTTGGVLFETSVINAIRNMGLSNGITINSGAGTVEFGESQGRRPIGLVLNASQTFTNNGAGDLIVWDHGTVNPSLALSVHTLTIGGSSNTTIYQRIVGTGGIIKTGAGALTLDDDAVVGSSTASTFSGTTTVNAGTLNINAPLALQNSVLNHVAGTVATDTTALTLGGLSGSVNFGTGGFFSTGFSGLTALTFNTGSITNATYSGNIGNGAGGLTITKTGLGTQILSGTNTYTGVTTVSAGTLAISGDSSGATGTATVTGGSLRLSGTFGGDLDVQSGAGLSGEGSTIGSTTFTNGTLFVDATTPGAFSAGDLDITNQVAVLWDMAPTAPGAVNLISYTGTLTTDGTVGGNVSADFDLSGIAVSSRAGSGVVTDNAGTIQVDLGYANRTWNNNAANGLWDIGTSANWVEGDNLFYEGDFVTFGDTGAGTVTINGADVNPITATFSNTTGNDYTINSTAAEAFQASGGISVTSSGNVTIDSVIQGITAINHSGTGTLALNQTNTFTGGVTVASGATLVTGASNGSALGGAGSGLTLASGGQWNASGGDFSALGAGGITLAGTGTGGGGALVNTTNALTLGGINLTGSTTISSDAALNINGLSVSGTGIALTKNGAGTTTLGGNNSTSAADLSQVINNAGDLTLVNNVNSLGGADLVMNAGNLNFTEGAGNTFTNNLVLNTTGAVNGPNGNITFAAGTTLTMTLGARIGGAGLNDSVRFEGIITGSGDITLGRSAGAGNQIGATADLTGYTGDFRLARTGPTNLTTLFINDGRTLTQDLVIVEGNNEQRIIGAISGSVEFAGQIILQEDNDGSFDIRANTGQTITISGNVADDGNGSGIDVIGTGGTVILSGTNTYGSGTRVQAGCLIITNPAAIPFNGVGTSVSAGAGLGFDPSGLSDAEMETIINNVMWDATSQLVFTVDSPNTEVVSANLSGFGGSTIVLKGTGTLDLSGATVPAGVTTYTTPDGGTIIGAPTATPITVQNITTGPGSVSGLQVTLAFTASGDVDAYASDSLQAGTWSLVASAISSSPAVVEDNVGATKRFYVLVPAGSGNPYPNPNP